MNEEIKEQWVKALRSGKYKQGREALRKKDPKTGQWTYCCLGVLCDLYQKKHQSIKWQENKRGGYCHIHDNGASLPTEVQEWAGLGHPSGTFVWVKHKGEHTVQSLVCVNDTLKWSFNTIANIIKKV